MPITFTVDHGRREVHSVASGHVTFAEIEGHILKQQDAGVRPIGNSSMDARARWSSRPPILLELWS